jgi:hypothetical protein
VGRSLASARTSEGWVVEGSGGRCVRADAHVRADAWVRPCGRTMSARTRTVLSQVTSKRTLQCVQVTDAPVAIVRPSVQKRPRDNPDLVVALLYLVFGLVILLLLSLNFLQADLLQSTLDLLSLQLVLCNELLTCFVIQASQGFILGNNPTYCLQGVKLLLFQGWNMLRTALKIPSNSTKMGKGPGLKLRRREHAIC